MANFTTQKITVIVNKKALVTINKSKTIKKRLKNLLLLIILS
jgi:hypothetical protein